MLRFGTVPCRRIFEPKVSGFKHVPLNDIDALAKAINPNTCAILLEPIQGEGGVFEVEENYIKAVRSICEDQVFYLSLMKFKQGLAGLEHYLPMNIMEFSLI